MSKDKRKKHGQFSQIAFLMTWILGHMAGWGVLLPIIGVLYVSIVVLGWQWVDNLIIELSRVEIVGNILIALVLGFTATIGQMRGFRLAQGQAPRHWFALSMLGWLIGGVISYGLQLTGLQSIFIYTIVLTLPATLLQLLTLRRAADDAGLWVLSSLAGSGVFAVGAGIVLWDGMHIIPALFLLAVIFGGYALVTGLVMLFIIGRGMTPPNQQVRQADDDTRLKRLSTDDEQPIERLVDEESQQDQRYLFQN